MRTLICGFDLAWGERNRDGWCLLSWESAGKGGLQWLGAGTSHGDVAVLDRVEDGLKNHDSALVCLDAPVICPNEEGSRPVDRLTHQLFRRQHAGCHPSSRSRCARPLRIVEALAQLGFVPGWRMSGKTLHPRLVAEVYPHPAIVRWFQLPQIVKYKRGPVQNRRTEFARLQSLLSSKFSRESPDLAREPELQALLASPWSKSVEDATDAVIAAWIGWEHVARHSKTEVLGDLETGFILIPSEN